MASAGQQKFLSRDEYKKKKELEEARKAGTAMPELDEDGKEINPHIPQYIAQAPWYINKDNAPTLKHQRLRTTSDFSTGWYKRGQRLDTAAKKYRKGACKNCGAMTHSAKDCMERPRKIGAKFNEKDLKPDEIIEEFQFDYEGKRDRWNGFDPDMYKQVIEKYERTENERKKILAKERIENIAKDEESSESEEEDFEFKEKGEEAGATAVAKDPKAKQVVRNLRIREDTAKYLLNLDPNSAYYDPKTRSMRANPNPDVDPEEADFAGENFVRFSGDAQKAMEATVFAWEAGEKGQDVHMVAMPTHADLFHKKYQEEKDKLAQETKQSVLEKYGGEEYLQQLPDQMKFAQSEAYVEYTRDGRRKDGRVRQPAKSRYDEDVYINNHTSVWGSYWENGQWGYKCCKQLVKKSICTANVSKDSSLLEEAIEKKERKMGSATNGVDGDKKDPEKERKEKLQRALEAEEKRQKMNSLERDERKRPFNSLSQDNAEVTEEELEAYRMKKRRFEDPMANLQN